MQKYGIIKNDELKLVQKGTPGAKPVVWEKLPEFDQTMQAVYEKPPVNKGDHIWVELEVRDVEIDEADDDGEEV